MCMEKLLKIRNKRPQKQTQDRHIHGHRKDYHLPHRLTGFLLGHSATFVGGRMFMFGGCQATG